MHTGARAGHQWEDTELMSVRFCLGKFPAKITSQSIPFKLVDTAAYSHEAPQRQQGSIQGR